MSTRQARLSRVMGAVTAPGTAAILWAWWDSTANFILWVNREWAVVSAASAIDIRLVNHSDFFGVGFSRIDREVFGVDEPGLSDLFPGIGISPGYLELPMWFLLCVFLSAMLLLWLVLMKRLARPRITEG